MCSLCVCSAYSQNKIKGKILDIEDNKVLSFANIAVLNCIDSVFISGTTTDENGFFEISTKDTSKFLLRISYLNYGTQIFEFETNKESKLTDLGDIKISKSAQQLTEFVIESKKPLYSFEGEKKIYNVSEDISVQGGVATDALQNAPGVYVDMEGNITLRGVSGVEIWINDKPSKIQAEGLKSFLQQLPANSINRIEVITNPSARYGAEGTGGIINIVTNEKIKKNDLISFGFNGSTQPSYSPWLSYAYSTEKFHINSYITYNSSKNSNISKSEGIVLNNNDTVYSVVSNSKGEWENEWMYGHLSFSWQIDTNTNIDFWGGFSLSKNNSFSNSNSLRTLNNGDLINFNRRNKGDNNSYNTHAGLSFDHNFKKKKGHKISINGYWGNFDSESLRYNERINIGLPNKNLSFKQNSEYRGTWMSSNIDYENPLKEKRKIEAGAQFGLNTVLSSSLTDTLNFASQQYEFVQLFSNSLDQKTYNGALYTTYSDTLWFINYKAGLRYEYASLNMNSIALNDELNRFWGSIFPTIHLSTRTKKNDNFTLSYARRLRYPMWELDPFVNRIDEESISSGNPYLDPTFTDSYEAAWAKFFKSGTSISSTIYHRRTNNDITYKSEGKFDQTYDRFTIFSTYINAGKNIYNGADFTINYSPIKNLRFIWYTNIYDQSFYADLGSYVIDKNDFAYNSRLTLMYNYKNIRMHIIGNYRSASDNIFGRTEPDYWINASLNADFFKRKLSLRLGMMDVFNWMERVSSTSTPTYISLSSSKHRSQFVNFGITFRFGKIELEKPQMAPSPGIQMNQ